MNKIHRCKTCVMPSTRPNIKFNEDGICYPCLEFERRSKVDWIEKYSELEALCSQYRGKGEYDCVICVSGGKDSHRQVGLFKELGMKPLGIMIDNLSWTDTGRANLDNLSEQFEIDIIIIKTNLWEMKYRTKEDFINEGHPSKYWDEILYKKPLELARKLGIGLVIWGENVGQFIGGVNPVPLDFPDLKVIFTSDYIPWSRFENVKYAKANGFKTIEDEWVRWGLELFPYEQIDTIGYLVNNYLKYVKFGFGVITEICSDMIRHGMMNREEALECIEKNEYKLDRWMKNDFCKFIGISSYRFDNIINKYKVNYGL